MFDEAARGTPIGGDYTGGSNGRQEIANRMLNIDVPRVPREQVIKRIDAGKDLKPEDLNQIACELAVCPEKQMERIVDGAWKEYTDKHPQIKQLVSQIRGGEYNPLMQPPAKVLVIPGQKGVASIGPLDNQSISQPVSEEVQRQLAVTQLLSPDGAYKDIYPTSSKEASNNEKVYEAWTHEGFHTTLNPLFKTIVDAADRIESEASGGKHLTVGRWVGKHGAITALQEVAVRLATSETLGTDISSLPDVLLSGGYVPILPELRTAAAKREKETTTGEANKGPDDDVWNEWYAHPLREDVRILCRTFIQMRAEGYDPIELARETNRIIALGLTHNEGIRHTDYDYPLVTGIVAQSIKDGRVVKTLPPMKIDLENQSKQREVIGVYTGQRKELQMAVARHWRESRRTDNYRPEEIKPDEKTPNL